ncbi:MAG TPA: RsmE family RNA methyltransferase [Puia sp.]|jgi:16S rRNA (uracil1498-N3)-methyltransferase|nr:RsmE family RNA methyltransferase [Puia sp.]
MTSPYFYFAHLATMAEEFVLNENSSRHIVQVLRMKPGENLRLTDGKGLSATAVIREAHKRHSRVNIIDRKKKEPPRRSVQIGLSLLKNTSRFEWFLEKATELGISKIIPLKCERTEKQQFRMERLQGILESAMIQSQQVWMPVLSEPKNFPAFVEEVQADQKFIAHCEPGAKRKLSELINTNLGSQIILIGPEGDFTEEEIKCATQFKFLAVELGENRLRSETAAVAAAAVLKLH